MNSPGTNIAKLRGALMTYSTCTTGQPVTYQATYVINANPPVVGPIQMQFP